MSRSRSSVSSLMNRRRQERATDNSNASCGGTTSNIVVTSSPISIPGSSLSSTDENDFVQEIGDYRIYKKMIGKGSFSTIWEAISIDEPDRKYVAKVSPKKKSRMINEHYYNSVDNLYSIQDHPNIIKLHHHVETNQHYYLFHDYHQPPTITLQEYLDNQQQCINMENSFEDSLSIFIQLISAISHMHRNGVAHRDLKPDNILINPEILLVTIIDFGFASSDTICMEHIGSPIYMSPEMLSEKPYDPKLVDIWSLGIIFYQLIFGMHPINNVKFISDLASAYVEPLNIPKYYPAWGTFEIREVDRVIREILELMLQRDPEKRASADLLEKRVMDKEFCILYQK